MTTTTTIVVLVVIHEVDCSARLLVQLYGIASDEFIVTEIGAVFLFFGVKTDTTNCWLRLVYAVS